MKGKCCLFSFFLLFLTFPLFAGTSGKVVGTVTDAATGDPLPAANIILEGTPWGASSDLDGYFMILNIPPGIYTLKASMMGYEDLRVTNVKISIDLTTKQGFRLRERVLDIGEEVTITAERPMVQMDLTSTSAVVGSEVIESLPVEEFSDIVNLQAGVVDGHFRGGRSSEVTYMVDGIPVNDPYAGEAAVTVENNAIQELEIISGTFNAEYGQAMSGVVNIVTKEGGKQFGGKLSAYMGDYISDRSSIFMNIDHVDPFSIKNVQGNLSGPVPLLGDKLSFFISGRSYYDEGYLYGKRMFNPSDSCDFSDPDPANWYADSTGDNAMVPMAPEARVSYQGKLTFRATAKDKVNYSFLQNSRRYKEYDHLWVGFEMLPTHNFRYNPDGDYQIRRIGYTHSLLWTHTVSANTFLELKFSNSFHKYRLFVYEDPFDPRYVDPDRLDDAKNNAFFTGGTRMWHHTHSTNTTLGKFELTSQITRVHQVKLGLEGKTHKLFLHEFKIIPKEREDMPGVQVYPFEPSIPPLSDPRNNLYTNYPWETSAYLQDKMEFEDMIVNAGVRFDYFYSNFKTPADYGNPDPQREFMDIPVEFEKAEPNLQLSPRLGIAYPISERGVIHGSYGHFFQTPNFEHLFVNPQFNVQPSVIVSKLGNADLKPQRTTIYELGLQQQLTDNLALDITGYFKDIRNLLGMRILETYEGRRYVQFINRDYGNVRGITVALENRPTAGFSASLDYTFQVAEGNSSDPISVFRDVKKNRESQKNVIPLDWDRTHSLNGTISLGRPGNWNLSVVGKLGTGFPYSPPQEGTGLYLENSERRPNYINFDLYLTKDFKLPFFSYSLYLKVYNLLDRLNEKDVFTDTGRATYTVEGYRGAGMVQGVNTLKEWFVRPDYYKEPRRVILGASMTF